MTLSSINTIVQAALALRPRTPASWETKKKHRNQYGTCCTKAKLCRWSSGAHHFLKRTQLDGFRLPPWSSAAQRPVRPKKTKHCERMQQGQRMGGRQAGRG